MKYPVPLQARVSENTYAQLKVYAKLQGLNISEAVRKLVSVVDMFTLNEAQKKKKKRN